MVPVVDDIVHARGKIVEPRSERKSAQILIVDDQDANVLMLEDLLAADGYTGVRSITDSRRVLPLLATWRPDLILLDLHMPYMDGLEILERVGPIVGDDAYLPILVLTADVTREAKARALSLGAKDFLTKPLDATEVLLRVRNLLETRLLHLRLQDENQHLEDRIRERTRDLEVARLQILERLAIAAEFRDDATGRHARRVGDLAATIARGVGLSEWEADLIGKAAPLHDVGKIGIPDGILLKPGDLTEHETTIMRTHTTMGAQILGGSDVPLLVLAQEIAISHHEHWDGAGYPYRLKGEAIPLSGRIVAVADAYDALTNDRPYRKALSIAAALEELWAGAGSQWEERVVQAFTVAYRAAPSHSQVAPQLAIRQTGGTP